MSAVGNRELIPLHARKLLVWQDDWLSVISLVMHVCVRLNDPIDIKRWNKCHNNLEYTFLFKKITESTFIEAGDSETRKG